MAGQHDHPNPMHHVQDEAGQWSIFHDLFNAPVNIPLGPAFFPGTWYQFRLTKFMLLELAVAILMIVIFVPLARKAARGGLPQGPWWNAFEVLLTFVRNDIARPTIGDEEADSYVPFLWTMFLFILFCNLLGMFPFMGSPTASIWVTGGLAFISFCMFHGASIAKMGPIRYAKSLWPHIEIVPNPWGTSGGHGHYHGHGHHEHAHGHGESLLPPTTGQIVSYIVGSIFGFGLSLMICTIELFGTVIKSGVLAVRLFANMFGGHMVLATLLFFIYEVGAVSTTYWLWGGVTFASVMGVVALSLLELFVAFLQAYVFTFLTSLFMGMALHPQH